MTGSGNRGRLQEIVAFTATALLWALLFLSAAAELRADAREALQKAVALVQEGRLEEADQQAQLALSNPQTRAVAYSVLGTIRFQQKRLPESVDLFQKAIRLDSRLLGAHLSLADVYTIQGKPELALGLYGGRSLDPSNAPPTRMARSETEGELPAIAGLRNPLSALKQTPDGLWYWRRTVRPAAALLLPSWPRLGTAADLPRLVHQVCSTAGERGDGPGSDRDSGRSKDQPSFL